jgi:hypothetical protein
MYIGFDATLLLCAKFPGFVEYLCFHLTSCVAFHLTSPCSFYQVQCNLPSQIPRPGIQAYLGYGITPSNYGLPQDTSLTDRVEKRCWTSLA